MYLTFYNFGKYMYCKNFYSKEILDLDVDTKTGSVADHGKEPDADLNFQNMDPDPLEP